MRGVITQCPWTLNKFITTTPDLPMRPLSQRQPSSSAPKPEFQTKLKLRNVGQADLASSTNSRLLQTERSRHDHSACEREAQDFGRTAGRLTGHNFSHHHDANCVCNDCHCGRHLCKLNVIKPDLSKHTVYQRSFYQQKHIPNVVNHDKEYDRLQGPHLDINSTYLHGYTGQNGDKLDRPIPEDLLKSNGPCPQLSSYSSQFPGYRGDNQYVKPTDKHTRGYFPLRSRSTYANAYIQKEPAKDDYTYFPDQLRSKSNWFGSTTYGNFYSNPNPEYFAKKVKRVEKLEENPDFSRQYETVYKNDFIPKPSPLCPSKIYLETKAQGHFLDTKGKFSQNADFKALSPEFHAISTSKHSYV